jgi:hypothetical protein
MTSLRAHLVFTSLLSASLFMLIGAQVALAQTKITEPSIKIVQEVALRYAALNPEIFKSMRSRSRAQAVLPQFTVRMTKDLDNESRSLTRYGDDDTSNLGQEISATEVVGDDLQLYAEARWKLNETIFNYQETAVMRENRYSAKERQKLLQTVTQVYFERKRALLKMKSFKGDAEQRELSMLKLSQIEAELDALTGGWFTKQLSIPSTGG